ncbi:Clp protease N-terminal domain-containing protein [Streptomyces sp. NPDC026672]|uniref:Clp protease N-terminal domain-containing protein n=1 Tax=unclassified Streptomyces TaxID=2593676 RepID=UPI0034003979
MQPRNPRRAADEQDARRVDDDAGLSAELAAVVAGARRRAVRDGDRQVDTAHLLHSLLESDPGVRAVTGDGPQLARLLGYLVQRSIGYGLRWQSSVEGSGTLTVLPVPRAGDPEAKDAGGWSPLATTAMERARDRALRLGTGPASGTDLLAAIVADPLSRAVEVLTRAGVCPTELRERLDRPSGEYADGAVTC